MLAGEKKTLFVPSSNKGTKRVNAAVRRKVRGARYATRFLNERGGTTTEIAGSKNDYSYT